MLLLPFSSCFSFLFALLFSTLMSAGFVFYTSLQHVFHRLSPALLFARLGLSSRSFVGSVSHFDLQTLLSLLCSPLRAYCVFALVSASLLPACLSPLLSLLFSILSPWLCPVSFVRSFVLLVLPFLHDLSPSFGSLPSEVEFLQLSGPYDS